MGLLDFFGLASEQTLENADANEKNQVHEALSFSDKDPQKRQEAITAYQQNYQQLYRQLPEGWRPYLLEMAKNATGQEIIANLPKDVKVKVMSFSSLQGAAAGYDPSKNQLQLTDAVKMQNRSFGKDDPYTCLVHECRHAVQDHLGLTLGAGNSAKDVAENNLFVEADAFAFSDTEGAIFQTFGTSKPDENAIKAFMNKDLLREKEKRAMGLGEETIKRLSDMQKKKPAYLLQQALKKTNGNLHLARKKMRGELLLNHLSTVGNLSMQQKYEMNGLKIALLDIYEGKADLNDDPDLTKKIKTEIAKANGVSLAEVEKNFKPTPAFEQAIKYIQNNKDMRVGDLYQGIEKIYQNQAIASMQSENMMLMRAKATQGER